MVLTVTEVTTKGAAEALHSLGAHVHAPDELRCSQQSLGPQPAREALRRYAVARSLAVVALYDHGRPTEYVVCNRETGEAHWLVLLQALDDHFGERHLVLSRWIAKRCGDFYGVIENPAIRAVLSATPGFVVEPDGMVRLG